MNHYFSLSKKLAQYESLFVANLRQSKQSSAAASNQTDDDGKIKKRFNFVCKYLTIQ